MADKNKTGRPLLFESAEELEKKIQEYLNRCKAEKDIPTLADLSVFLDCDRKTFYNYEDRDDFFPTIKRVKDKILAIQEKMALKGELQPTVWIFTAKNNFGYSDRQEIVSNNTNMNLNTEVSGETDADRIKSLVKLMSAEQKKEYFGG